MPVRVGSSEGVASRNVQASFLPELPKGDGLAYVRATHRNGIGSMLRIVFESMLFAKFIHAELLFSKIHSDQIGKWSPDPTLPKDEFTEIDVRATSGCPASQAMVLAEDQKVKLLSVETQESACSLQSFDKFVSLVWQIVCELAGLGVEGRGSEHLRRMFQSRAQVVTSEQEAVR